MSGWFSSRKVSVSVNVNQYVVNFVEECQTCEHSHYLTLYVTLITGPCERPGFLYGFEILHCVMRFSVPVFTCNFIKGKTKYIDMFLVFLEILYDNGYNICHYFFRHFKFSFTLLIFIELQPHIIISAESVLYCT